MYWVRVAQINLAQCACTRLRRAAARRSSRKSPIAPTGLGRDVGTAGLASGSVVVRPHPDDLDDSLLLEDLIDETMLDVDPPRAGSGKVAKQLLELTPGLRVG